ncbi:FecR family protein [Lutibacter sp.]
MKRTKSEELIAKYFTNSISTDELDYLSTWIEEQDNNELLISSVKTDYAIRYNMSQYNTKKSQKLLLKKIRKDKSILSRFKIKQTFKYAAIALFFLSTGYFMHNYFFNDKKSIPVAIDHNSIILQLDNGSIKVLSENGTAKIVSKNGAIIGSQKGNQLIYDNEVKVEKIVYNTLTVPYGKRFELKLSEGTHIHLNSGTSLKYPVKFLKGEDRQVFLNGEAFFDVAKDSLHPFIVNMNDVGVRVLGTKFNASSYPENNQINTVLVEGSVRIFNNTNIYNKTNSILLKPGYKASWNKRNNKISINRADIALHTAWIKGKIMFRHLPFKNIIKKLERQYDVTIMNNNKTLGNEFFTASFDSETIEQVMQTFHKNYGINYSIINKQIIIN